MSRPAAPHGGRAIPPSIAAAASRRRPSGTAVAVRPGLRM